MKEREHSYWLPEHDDDRTEVEIVDEEDLENAIRRQLIASESVDV